MKVTMSLFSAAVILASCNGNSNKEAELVREKQLAIDSMKHVMEKKAIVDSMNTVMAKNQEAQQEKEEAQRAEEKNSQVVANSNNGIRAQSQPARKKGWNHMAKGAVVGAGTGAVTGALVNKNRGEGAIVGSLIGAGVGTATGAFVDNSQKKKRQSNRNN